MTVTDCNSIITTTNNNLDISTFNSTNTTKNTNETSNNTKIDDIHSIWRICLIGGFFCMISGYINAVSYESFNISVTHISGTTTHCGINLARTNVLEFFKSFMRVNTFIFGSMMSSLCLGGTRKFKGGVRYVYILYIVSMLSFTSILVFSYQHLYVASLLLTLTSGMLNALTTTYSGAVVRVTHVTGTATDIGIELGKIIGNRDYSGLWRLKLFFIFISSFCIGGSFGYLIWNLVGMYSLMIPGMLIFLVAFVYHVLLKFPSTRILKCGKPGANKGLFVM